MKSCHLSRWLFLALLLAVTVNISYGTASTPLVDAVLENDNQALKEALSRGAPVDGHNEQGETALIWACYMGNNDAVDLLLKHGANPHTICKAGISPLMAAALNGRLSVIKTLLANPDPLQKNPETLVHAITLALEKGHIEAALLIQQGIEALEASVQNQTPVAQSLEEKLIQACHLGDLTSVKDCLGRGSKIDGAGTPDCMTPLVVAIAAGNKEVVDLLLERGASVNVAVKDGWTPFIAACHSGQGDIVQKLIEKGADIDARTRDGWSGLELSTANKHNETASILMKKLMTIPWAETAAKSADDSDRRLCIRRNPTRSSDKSGCVKIGEKLTLSGFWTDDGWAQVILPYSGWVRTDKINTTDLPENKRGVLMSQRVDEARDKTAIGNHSTTDSQPQKRTNEIAEEQYQDDHNPSHYRRHNWR